VLDAGPVIQHTHEADLRRVYGDANVRDERIQIGEGESAPGAVLFPDDSLRRLEIIWGDSSARGEPSRLILRGSKSKWSLEAGVSLGSTLAQLEKLNGRPFTLAGFGWDFAGVVLDWNGGSLADESRNVKVYLAPDAAKQSTPEYSQVLGDKKYSSDLPEMRALEPKVYQIFYDLDAAQKTR
jgi:hypothetical protein